MSTKLLILQYHNVDVSALSERELEELKAKHVRYRLTEQLTLLEDSNDS